jgi:hypothetical protein
MISLNQVARFIKPEQIMKNSFHILPQTIAKLGLAIGSLALLVPAAIANTVENDDLRFKLQGCQHKGELVVCRFLITNLKSQKRYVSFFSTPIRIIDVSGSEFLKYEVWLGNSYANTLLPGVPMKGSVSFKNVPRTVTKLSVLELGYANETEITSIQFNNIIIGGGKTTSDQPTESNTSDTASTSTCPNGEKTFLAAETNNFDIAICGKNKPTHYVGKSKQGGSSIKLPLSKASQDRYIAKNGNVNYIVTPKYLSIVQNGRTIQQDALTILK